MNTLRTLTTLAATLVLIALPTGLSGQAQYEVPPEGEGPYERRPEAIEAINRLKSPYCPGLMLEVCTSAPGAALRDSIAKRADAGWSADSIVEWVVANHGEKYRAMPKAEGAALLAWIVPPLGVAVGIGIVVVALRRMRKRRGDEGWLDPDLLDEISSDEEERLNEALRELEEEEEAPFI